MLLAQLALEDFSARILGQCLCEDDALRNLERGEDLVRKKDMIKTGGENVASREVEEAIYRLPGVSEVAVIGVPHPRFVEAMVAVVAPKAGATLDEKQVLEHSPRRGTPIGAPISTPPVRTCRSLRSAADGARVEAEVRAQMRGS